MRPNISTTKWATLRRIRPKSPRSQCLYQHLQGRTPFLNSRNGDDGRNRWLQSYRSFSNLERGFTARKPSARLSEYLPDDPSLDTIYALSTAHSSIPSALAIIRISGPLCAHVYQSLTRDSTLPKPRVATVRELRDPNDQNDILDPQALILRFEGPKSVTGEDVIELHVHGGLAVVDGVLSAIGRCTNLSISQGRIRYAEPGEFTRRAVLNGLIDISAAESLGDVLSARTASQLRVAAKRSSSAKKLADTYDGWRNWLTSARGVLEGIIDFSEDQQFEESPAQLMANIVAEVQGLQDALRIHAKNAERGELLRRGAAVALIGKPNTGKSSLLNLIVGREAAIVSDEKGTTRDVLEVGVDLRGWLCRFVDTAGLRTGKDGENVGKVEREGIRRAKQRAMESDVLVVMVSPDDSGFTNNTNEYKITIDEETMQTAKECAATGAKLILAINKTDLFPDPIFAHSNERQVQISNLSDLIHSINESSDAQKQIPVVQISCKLATNAQSQNQVAKSGIQNLLDALVDTFKEMTSAVVSPDHSNPKRNENEKGNVINAGQNGSYFASDDAAAALGANERQKQLLERCVSHLESFLDLASTSPLDSQGIETQTMMKDDQLEHIDLVLAAESLRNAADCLGKITGRGDSGDVEDVLGVVFQKFCVGK